MVDVEYVALAAEKLWRGGARKPIWGMAKTLEESCKRVGRTFFQLIQPSGVVSIYVSNRPFS